MTDTVAIFWDYENCPVPSTTSGCAVVSKISILVRPFGSVRLFRAYLEVKEHLLTSKSLGVRSELQSSGVSLVDCPHNGRKDVADKMMLVDMLAYAIDVPSPSTIVLITGDRDFAYALSVLKLRRYHVVLITLPNAHTTITYQASQCFDWIQDVINSPPVQTVHTSPWSPQSIPEPAASSSESEDDVIDQDQPKEDTPTSPSPSGSFQSSDYHPIRLAFLPLLNVFLSHKKEGRYRLLRSQIGANLVKENDKVYQNAGVKSFKEYMSMAEKEGLVTLGGLDGHAWVSFKPSWDRFYLVS